MKTQPMLRLSSVAAAVWLAGAALAQPPEGQPSPAPRDTVFFATNAAPVMAFGGAVDVLFSGGTIPGEVVTGKPYTAASITESTQLLADGNRIVQRNEARVARDSAGRTRREQALNGLGVWQTGNEPVTLITINDPVEDVTYVLDPNARTARKMPPFRLATRHQAGEELPALPAGRAAAFGSAIRGAVKNGDLRALRAPSSGVPAIPAMRGAPPRAALAGQVSSVTEDLGEQVLEGVLARGTRHTQTIAAGALGNERPIEIIAERWYSAALDADVLRRNYDPRFGETIYRLVSVVQGEPSPELFVVPQGYETVTVPEPQFGLRRVERRIDAAGRETVDITSSLPEDAAEDQQ